MASTRPERQTGRWFVPLALVLAVTCSAADGTAETADPADQQTAGHVVEQIDEFLSRHWAAHEVRPAAAADDAAFLRRITLDLAGRIPLAEEVIAFGRDESPGKRGRLVGRLLDGDEFPLHFANLLDEMIQGPFAGDDAYRAWLRRGLQQNKSWDAFFQEMLVGPWETDQQKPANRFLDRRARDLDRLTVDATRVFFGIDISCAKCHDHPLVSDWKQEHYYGMASFFHWTSGGRGSIGEKDQGDLTYLADGREQKASMMFLSGVRIEQPEDAGKNYSRRAQLLQVALQDEVFFRHAVVNRLWEYFFGRGLVDPVDQMHSANPSAVPGLLEWLAADFAAHGYDLRRLVRAIVSSRAYQLSSRWDRDEPLPDETLFAVSRLRPLSPRQYAVSLLLATENERLAVDVSQVNETEGKDSPLIEQRLAVQKRAERFLGELDRRQPDFQSSTGEALFLSNSPVIHELVSTGLDETDAEAGDADEADAGNLAARLGRLECRDEIVRTAILHVLSRPADEQEVTELSSWLSHSAIADELPLSRCEQLVWSLVTSAEFRFVH